MDFAKIAFGALAGVLVGFVVSFTTLLQYLYYRRTEKRNILGALLAILTSLAAVAVLVAEPRLRDKISVLALAVAFVFTLLFAFIVAFLVYKQILPAPPPQEKLPLDSYTHQARQKINQRDFESGLKLAQRALEASPRDAEAYIEKGRALKRLGRLNEALQSVEEGLNARPDDPRLLYNRACYRSLLGEDDEAVLGDLEKAFTLMPKLKENASMDSDLQRVQKLDRFRELVSL